MEGLFRSAVKKLSGYGLGSNPVVAKAYKAASKKMMPQYINFEGSMIFMDSPDAISLAINGFEHEALSIETFKQNISEGTVVLDIGANIGIYTLIAARHGAIVHSFEPDPVSFANLEHNVRGNGYSSVILHNSAASNVNGEAQFFQSDSNLDRTSNHIINEPSASGIAIDTVRIEDLVQSVNLIKMDVEGSEYNALKGMERLIRSYKPALLMEYNPKALSRMDVDIPQFIDYLFSFGYSVSRIDEKEGRLIPVNHEWLLSFMGSKDNVNLFLQHSR